jgi:hypothetical protein
MCIKLRVGIMVLGMMANIASAESPHRLVIVVVRPTDPRATKQQAALELDAAALGERDVVVQEITPEVARRERPELGVSPDVAFELLLVGKDGGIKKRWDEPVAASEISRLIDTMPMRRYEMQR